MVKRAVAANPQSGAMIDSLGWAHYRLGDYKKAVELLEQAVELEAGDPGDQQPPGRCLLGALGATSRPTISGAGS